MLGVPIRLPISSRKGLVCASTLSRVDSIDGGSEAKASNASCVGLCFGVGVLEACFSSGVESPFDLSLTALRGWTLVGNGVGFLTLPDAAQCRETFFEDVWLMVGVVAGQETSPASRAAR
jgi:hypothetical protein